MKKQKALEYPKAKIEEKRKKKNFNRSQVQVQTIQITK
jgi:hypothetical protein